MNPLLNVGISVGAPVVAKWLREENARREGLGGLGRGS